MSIPKDGYYMAKVQLDTGGQCPHYVHVKDGKPYSQWGDELLPEACGEFQEIDTTLMVRVWPEDAAMKLEALRNACDGLMRGMKALRDTLAIDDGRDCLEEVFQMRDEVQALRTANAGLVKEVRQMSDLRERAEERVKRFTEALSDPVAVWANMLRGTIAMPQHIPELERRLTDAHALAERFQKAGQDAIDYIDGKHRDAGRVLDGWRKANQ